MASLVKYYDQVCSLIIRPTRADYEITDLGPARFMCVSLIPTALDAHTCDAAQDGRTDV